MTEPKKIPDEISNQLAQFAIDNELGYLQFGDGKTIIALMGPVNMHVNTIAAIAIRILIEGILSGNLEHFNEILSNMDKKISERPS